MLNIHWKDWCWSWNSKTLATWCERTDPLEKTLMLGKIEGRRRREWQRMRCLDSITDAADMSLRRLWEWVMDLEGWCVAVHRVQRVGHDWATELITPYTMINSKWIKDLNVRPETIKLLEENIGKTLSDIHHSRILYDPPPRILEIKAKINKMGSN